MVTNLATITWSGPNWKVLACEIAALAGTRMHVHDGEEIHGVIEWYDRACIKLNRTNAPNLMIYKPSIKYMYKEGENSRK